MEYCSIYQREICSIRYLQQQQKIHIYSILKAKENMKLPRQSKRMKFKKIKEFNE